MSVPSGEAATARGRWILALAWAAPLAAASLLLYRIPLDSDRLYFDQLFSDLRGGGAWSDWRLALAPGYFPDLLLYGLAHACLPAPAWRLFAVSVAQVLACGGAALILLREVLPARSGAAAAGVLGMLGLTVLVATRTGAWLFLNDNNAHVGALLSSLLCAALALRHLRHGSATALPVLAAVAAAGWLSSQLFVLSFVLPSLALLGLAAWQAAWLRRPALAAAAAIVAGGIGGIMLRRLLTANEALGHKLKYSLDAVGHAVRMLGEAGLGLLRQPASGQLLSAMLVLALLAAAACAAAALRGGRFVREPQAPHAADRLWTAALALFAVVSLGAILAGAVASGGFADDKSMRYLHLPLALAVLAGIAMLERYAPRLLAAAAAAACALCLIWAGRLLPVLRAEAGGLDIVQMGQHGMGRIGEERVADCLEDARRQGLPLQAGASQYWLARSVGSFAGVPMFAVLSDLQPFFWMSTIGPMRHPAHYRYRFNFLLVQEGGELEPFRFTPAEVARHAPAPDRVLRCAQAPVQLWWYADERLDAVLRRQAAAAGMGR